MTALVVKELSSDTLTLYTVNRDDDSFPRYIKITKVHDNIIIIVNGYYRFVEHLEYIGIFVTVQLIVTTTLSLIMTIDDFIHCLHRP